MKKICILLLLCLSMVSAFGQISPSYDQKEVAYDRRDGVSLTMTVLTPKNANGKGIISVLSGNFVSDYNLLNRYRDRALILVQHGYTVFLMMHRSAPRYAIPDMLEDIQRCVQVVRFHAADYHVDPSHLGITGTSSGGYLALLTALSKDIAEPESKDVIARFSSKLQAAAVFCAPTDIRNYGQIGYNLAEDKNMLLTLGIVGAFAYTNWDKATRTYEAVTDLHQRQTLDSLLSPVQLVSKNSPPVYLIHGDKDPIVPLQQPQSLAATLQGADVPVKLVLKPGAGHGWKNMDQDGQAFNLWFDQYLK